MQRRHKRGVALTGIASRIFAGALVLGSCSSEDVPAGEGRGHKNETLSYCPGVDPWPEGSALCGNDTDCPAEHVCYFSGSYPPPLCPPHCTGGASCVTDSDCTADEICASTDDPCSCDSRQCTRSCAMTGCPDDQRCAATGHCEPIHCADGWACPPGSVCDFTRGYAGHGCRPLRCNEPGALPCSPNRACTHGPFDDLHGVDEVGCTTRWGCGVDFECACGVCSRGWCVDGPGVCAARG